MNAKYFTEEELNCNHCGKFALDDKTVFMFDKLREYFGKPIVIHSFYRCEEWNKKVGGVDSSQHTKGKAGDFHVNGITMEELHTICLDLWERNYILKGGLGLYDTFVHIDSNSKRKWDKRA